MSNEIRIVDVTKIQDHPDVPNIRSKISKSDIADLKKSIKERGLQNPLTCFELKDSKEVYMLSGWRRRAALMELLEEDPKNKNFRVVPAVFKKYKNGNFIQEALFDNMVENIQRADVNGYDLAERIKKLIDGGLNKPEICKQIGKSITWLNDTLKFIDDSDESVKDKVKAGEISLSDAKKVSKLPKDKQSIVGDGIAHANKTGNKKAKKQINEKLEEAIGVKTHKAPCKKDVDHTRNIIAVILSAEGINDNEKIMLKGALGILEWVLGNTSSSPNFQPYLDKYKISVDKKGNRVIGKIELPKSETQEAKSEEPESEEPALSDDDVKNEDEGDANEEFSTDD